MPADLPFPCPAPLPCLFFSPSSAPASSPTTHRIAHVPTHLDPQTHHTATKTTTPTTNSKQKVSRPHLCSADTPFGIFDPRIQLSKLPLCLRPSHPVPLRLPLRPPHSRARQTQHRSTTDCLKDPVYNPSCYFCHSSWNFHLLSSSPPSTPPPQPTAGRTKMDLEALFATASPCSTPTITQFLSTKTQSVSFHLSDPPTPSPPTLPHQQHGP